MHKLLTIMRRLRAPDGCPWDQQQTHHSLRPYLLEEAAEAVDAVDSGDYDHLAEELGDVLLQIAFHAVIAEEAGTFSYDSIESSIVDKLIRRHPHVFADTRVRDAEEVVSNWQAIKASEPSKNKTKGISSHLPSLMRAAEYHKQTGSAPSLSELQDSLSVLGSDSEAIGTFLLAFAAYAQAQGVNPDMALRDALKAKGL